MSSNAVAGDFDYALVQMDSLIKESAFDSAMNYGMAALQDADSMPGPDDTLTAKMLDRLALCCWNKSHFAMADSLWRRSLQIFETYYGFNHPDVINIYRRRAINFNQLGRDDEAVGILERTVANIIPQSDTVNIMLTQCLNTLAHSLWEAGRLDEAEACCRRAVVIADSTFGPNHPYSASGLINLANIQSRRNKFVEADDLFRRSLAILESDSKPNDRELIPCYYYYAHFLKNCNHIRKAAEYYERCFELINKKYGREHHYMIACLIHLGNIRFSLYEYDKSRSCNLLALALTRGKYGNEHPYIAAIIGNMANCEYQMGHYAQADSLISESLRLEEALYGPDYPLIYGGLAMLADVKSALGQEDASREYVRRALDGISRRFAGDGMDVAKGLETLLSLCRELDSTSIFDPQFYGLIERIGSLSNTNNIDQAFNMQITLSNLCRTEGMIEEAIEFGKFAYRLNVKSMRTESGLLSDYQLIQRLYHLDHVLGTCLGIYWGNADAANGYLNTIAEMACNHKRLVTNILPQRGSNLSTMISPECNAQRDTLIFSQKRLAAVFIGAAGDQAGPSAETDSLLGLIERLETSLSRYGFCPADRDVFAWMDIDSMRICLPDNAILVEFLRFSHSEYPRISDDHSYMAVVIDKEREPALIELGSSVDVETAVEEYQAHMNRVAGRGGTVTDEDVREYRTIGKKIYDIIWAPIEQYLEGKQLALIAPDGYLNKLSFASLPDGNGSYLIEKAAVHTLASAGDITRIMMPYDKNKGMLAIGAPDFDATLTAATIRMIAGIKTPDINDDEDDVESSRVCDNLADICLQPIPGAGQEIDLISGAWKVATDEEVIVFTGREASESRFKREAQGKRIIHLATHGYFLDCDYDRLFASDIDRWFVQAPALFSGLFWTEANHLENSGSSPDHDDGVLTALEVSTMNLEGTELVVLSACGSGLGHFFYGHESFGLSWAFRKAGVRTVVSTLWPVSDNSAPGMFVSLYNREGEYLAATMQAIQLECIRKERTANRPDHPVSWGAYISVGDWR